MSLIDLILGQKIVLATIGLAGLILVTALSLAIVPHLKQILANRKAQRALAAQEAALQAEAESSEELNPQQSLATTAPRAVKPPAPAAAATPTRAAAQPGTAPTSVAQASPLATSTTSASPSAGQSEEQTSSAMQDILSSVFSNDEALERFRVLLQGAENLPASELLALCSSVSDQLRAKYGGVPNH
jgi:hypothetical protein